MSVFSKQDKIMLRSLGADAHLPELTVFQEKSGAMHISPQCGWRVTQVKYLDFQRAERCSECHASEDRPALNSLHTNLSVFRNYLMIVLQAKELLVKARKGKLKNIFDLAKAFSFLRVEISEMEEYFRPAPLLEPLVSKLRVIADDLDAQFVEYLHTDKAKILVEKHYAHVALRGKEADEYALLLKLDALEGYHLLAAITYSVELTPGVYLFQGPAKVRMAVEINSRCSKVTIGESTPLAVLETMAALWDFDSKGALSDAQKALLAAWELTPNV